MSIDIASILANKNFDEPAEITAIKAYIQRHFKSDASVTLRQDQIIINVPNAALAGALRSRLYDLQQECKIEKRLVIRIGL